MNITSGTFTTRDGVSLIPAGHVGLTLIAYLIGYSILFILFLLVAGRWIARGPEMEKPTTSIGTKPLSQR